MVGSSRCHGSAMGGGRGVEAPHGRQQPMLPISPDHTLQHCSTADTTNAAEWRQQVGRGFWQHATLFWEKSINVQIRVSPFSSWKHAFCVTFFGFWRSSKPLPFMRWIFLFEKTTPYHKCASPKTPLFCRASNIKGGFWTHEKGV